MSEWKKVPCLTCKGLGVIIHGPAPIPYQYCNSHCEACDSKGMIDTRTVYKDKYDKE